MCVVRQDYCLEQQKCCLFWEGQVFRIGTVRYAEGLWCMRRRGRTGPIRKTFLEKHCICLSYKLHFLLVTYLISVWMLHLYCQCRCWFVLGCMYSSFCWLQRCGCRSSYWQREDIGICDSIAGNAYKERRTVSEAWCKQQHCRSVWYMSIGVCCVLWTVNQFAVPVLTFAEANNMYTAADSSFCMSGILKKNRHVF